jgi:hypothetical protein
LESGDEWFQSTDEGISLGRTTPLQPRKEGRKGRMKAYIDKFKLGEQEIEESQSDLLCVFL